MSVVADVLAYYAGCGIAAYDSFVPTDPPQGYAVVYSDDGHPASVSLCGTADSDDHKVRVLSVGVNPQQCRLIRGVVKSLEGQRVGAALVRHEYGNPMVPDDDLPGSVLSAYDQFDVPVVL